MSFHYFVFNFVGIVIAKLSVKLSTALECPITFLRARVGKINDSFHESFLRDDRENFLNGDNAVKLLRICL